MMQRAIMPMGDVPTQSMPGLAPYASHRRASSMVRTAGSLRRVEIEIVVEALIVLLDQIDGDCDLEPGGDFEPDDSYR